MNVPSHRRLSWFTLTCGYGLFLVVMVSYLTNCSWIHLLDAWGQRQVLRFPHPQMTPVASFFTYLGQQQFTIILAGALVIGLILKKHLRWAIFLSQNIILGSLLNHVIKQLIQRPRPELTQLLPQGGYSFPSGHSSNSVLLYGTIWILFCYLGPKWRHRRWLVGLPILLALCIGISRVYLQVHFPTDVLAGWTSALGDLSLFYLISAKTYLPIQTTEPHWDQ